MFYLDLWQEARTGNKEAFCRLGEDHYALLFNYGLNFTSDRELIKDTIQDLYLHLWESRGKIQMEQVSFYLLKAIRNNILQTYRVPAGLSLPVDDQFFTETDENTIESKIIIQETTLTNNSRIQKAILDLPTRQKEVIFLKYYQGLDNEQIASLININRQSVANLLFKALITLRKQIPHLINSILLMTWSSARSLF